MIRYRLGIYDTTVHGHILRHPLDLLVHYLWVFVPAAVIVLIGIGQRLVVSQHLIVSEIITEVHRHRSSRLSELLAKKEGSACRPVTVAAHIVCETSVGVGCITIHRAVRMKFRMFHIVSGSEIELRFEKEGGIFGKIVLHTDSETVSL